MLAIFKARSMATSEGLQTIGVFGNTDPALGWAKCPIMSKISEPLVAAALEDTAEPTNSMSSSSSDGVLLWTGFSVSKHNMPSKQSSNPSLRRAFRAWTLSALVKICYTEKKNI